MGYWGLSGTAYFLPCEDILLCVNLWTPTCQWARSIISSTFMTTAFVSLDAITVPGVFDQGDHDHVNTQTNYGPWQRLTIRLILCRGISANWIRLLTGA